MTKILKFIKPEYEIALEQLDRLNAISKERLLSAEEIKAYDVLVKNLRLIEDDPTVIEGTSSKVKELTVDDALDMLLPKPESSRAKGITRVKKQPKAD